jgi:hypothetical protein
MNLVTPKAGAKHEPFFNKPAIEQVITMHFATPKGAAKYERFFRGLFVEQKLMLSSNFRCYQIHD